eukprot:1343756-Amorphochlora_amoeboformis.AAC.1
MRYGRDRGKFESNSLNRPILMRNCNLTNCNLQASTYARDFFRNRKVSEERANGVESSGK